MQTLKSMVMMACPDCQEVKMGPDSIRSKMGRCDSCGKPTKEMALI
jgi:hypothetical protein